MCDMRAVEDLTRADPAGAGGGRGARWAAMGVALGVALLYGCFVAAVALDRGQPDYRVDPSGDEASLANGQWMVQDLPGIVRAGVDYPVRILIPPAVPGSRLKFTLFDRSMQRLSVPPMGIALCGPTEDPDTAPCSITDRRDTFDYQAGGVMELPATLSFTDDQVGRTFRLQYQVLAPRSAWNPFAERSYRVYILSDVQPTA